MRVLCGLLCWIAACAQGAEWRSTGPWGGTVRSLAVREGVLLAGAHNSLIYRSVDEGRHWERLPFPRHFLGTVAAVAISPQKKGFYLAGLSLDHSTEAGVWWSEDAGRSWRQAKGLEGIGVQALAQAKSHPGRVVAGTREGVWQSEDGGRSWTRLSAPYLHELRAVTSVAVHPADPNTVYAGTTHLPWRTTDGGKTWESIHTGMLDDSDVFSIYVDPRTPERVLASACSGIYRSTNGGGSWTKFQGIPATLRRTHAIASPETRPEVVYAGTTLGLLKSTNGGVNFQQMNQLPILAMALEEGRIWLATAGGGVLVSEDGGVRFEARNVGLASRRLAAVAEAGEILYASVMEDGASGGIYRSGDGAKSWQLAGPWKGAYVPYLAGCADGETVYSGNESSVFRSKDGGKNWIEVKAPLGRVRALACVGKVLFAGTDRGLVRSADGGGTWLAAKLTTAPIQHDVVELRQAAGRMVARTAQAVYLSEDAGTTWRVLNILFPVSLVNDLALKEGNGGALVAATTQGLYVSPDGGRSWQKRQEGMEPGTVSALAVEPGAGGRVYASQFGRIYQSGDSGTTWSRLEGGELGELTVRRLLVRRMGGKTHLIGVTPDAGVEEFELGLGPIQ